MSKIAFLFPGQGSQYAGMGQALAQRFPAAQAAFAEADEALGWPLSALCFTGPEAELQLTANTQPAILATSIAAYRTIAENGLTPDYVAGHSLGEYAALVAAGSLSLRDAVKLVRARGAFMQDAVPVGAGAMAAILGLPADAVAAACAAAAQGEICAPANFNTPTQTVIAGTAAAITRAIEACQTRGAKRAMLLKVSAPFHCALMSPVQTQLEPMLTQTAFADLRVPLINNVDAISVSSGAAARAGLLRQIAAPVRWTESINLLLEKEVTTFVEIGPGKVLSGLVKAIAKDAGREVQLFNLEDEASRTATLSALTS